MKVTVAKGAGFCAGVQAAFDLAMSLAEKFGNIYTIGELVHNELVTEYLERMGAHCLPLDKLDTLKAGDVALIRAHGIAREIEQALKDRGVNVYDATCPVVKRNQRIAEEQRALNRKILIVGDKNHDEVVGLKSYAGKDAVVIPVGESLDIGEEDTAILFQTTVLPEIFEKIDDSIKIFKKNHRNLVEIFNTICYTTKARQTEARSLAETSDAVVVLGSRSSANTRRLFEVAKEVNPNVFFVSEAEDLSRQNILNKDFQSISIVAGASTPPWLIREVSKSMSETQNPADIATETEATKEATLQEQEQTEAPKEPTMEDILKSNHSAGYTNYKVGKRIRGTVISAGENGVFVAIGGKKDGFIDKTEASVDGNYDPADFKPGDEVQAVILAVNKDYVALSKKSVDVLLKEEEEAEKALSQGEFRLKMTEVVKGGLRGHLGSYTIFVPASQIRMGYVSNLEDYKDKELRLVLMPPKEKEKTETEGEEVATETEGAEVSEEKAEEKPKRRSKYLFASQRIILEREKKAKEDEFWENIHVHDIVTGKVKRFTSFGAFVSVRGFDCLAHISELSWNKISDPSAVLKIGESYDFVVLKLDRATGKISLGYKQLQKKPYELAAEKYPVGTVVKGKVERIFPFGAFVSIDEGVDGLIHISQIAHRWVKDASEVFTVGQEVEAKIIGFEDNRITLSVKELLPAPEESETPAEDTEVSEEERAAKRSSRMKRFEQKVADGERRERKNPRKESSNEPKEWVSGSSSASIGDLLTGLNIELADDTTEEPKE